MVNTSWILPAPGLWGLRGHGFPGAALLEQTVVLVGTFPYLRALSPLLEPKGRRVSRYFSEF